MFVRVKTTPNSPRQSVQIVESVRDGNIVKQKILRHVGIAQNDIELVKLKELAEFICAQIEEEHQPKLFSPEDAAKLAIQSKQNQDNNKKYNVNLKNLKEEQRIICGIHEIFGKIYEEIGFSKIIKDPARNKKSLEILQNIVLARIANPLSKRGSVNMLERDFGIFEDLEQVYRMMDKLDDQAIQKIQDFSYEYTKTLLGGKVDVMFYDCTTLYFESFNEGVLRQCGFSKDHKFQETQILLALIVTKAGLPIGYEVFPGKTYEGHTLIPILEKIKTKYDLDKIIFVADSGLLNEKNLKTLDEKGFKYIVGARIKNMPLNIQTQIFKINTYKEIKTFNNKEIFKIKNIPLDNIQRQLIVSFSSVRARKDINDRQKAILKVSNKIKKNTKVKDLISQSSFKKYLLLDNNENIKIDDSKILKHSKWDGLHGVITNAKDLTDEYILNHYSGLWQIEESFRISKHDLKIRPVFHWKSSRIKAHLAIAFMAFTCVRHLEYRINLQYQKLSPEIIRQELIRVQASILIDQKTKFKYCLPSNVSEHAKKIYKLMHVPLKSFCSLIEPVVPSKKSKPFNHALSREMM